MELQSQLPLRVYQQVFLGNDKPLGYTLDGGVSVPDGVTWYVRHNDDQIDDDYLDVLVAEVVAKKIPGLSLASCRRLTDAGLQKLLAAKHLETLDLFNARIGDVGAATISRLSNLKSLNLAGTAVTDSATASLARLERLERLHLGWTSIGDAALEPLARIKSLRMLDLRSTRISNAGLKQLASMTALETLGLQETQVGDVASLLPLAPTLVRLYLGYSTITDESIDHLKTFSRLRTLMLRGTRLRRDADASLRTSLTSLGGLDSGPDGAQEGLIR